MQNTMHIRHIYEQKEKQHERKRIIYYFRKRKRKILNIVFYMLYKSVHIRTSTPDK